MADSIDLNVNVKAVEDSASFERVSAAFAKALSDGTKVGDIFKPLEVQAGDAAKALNDDFSGVAKQFQANMASGFNKMREIIASANLGDAFNTAEMQKFVSLLGSLSSAYTQLSTGSVQGEQAIDALWAKIDKLHEAFDSTAVAALKMMPASLVSDISDIDAAMGHLHESVEIFSSNLEAQAVLKNEISTMDEEERQLNELADAWSRFYAARDAKRAASSQVGVSQAELQNAFSQYYAARDAANAGRGAGDLGGQFQATGQKMQTAFSKIGAAAKTAFSAIRKVAQPVLNLLRRGLQAVADVAKKAFSHLLNLAKVSLSKLTSSIFSARKQADGLRSAFSQLKGLAIGGLSLYGLKNLSKSMLKLSSDVIEVQNVVDTVFGEMSKTVDEFAANASKSFGLTSLQAKKYAGQLGGMLKSSGFDETAAAKMSINLTKLSADVASFYNLDHDEAFKKIQAGIAGTVAPLRSLGVSLTEANLEAFRMAKGIETSYSAMSQAERVALRYNYIMSALKAAQGDFTKTSSSWANQVRLLSNQLHELGAILGGLLQKVLYPVLVVVNKILSLAISGASALAKMLGFDMEGLKKQQGSLGGGGVVIGDDGASAMEDLADSTDDATAAQKKLNAEQKKGLANVHQLNVLQDKSSSGADAGGAGSFSADGVGFDLADYVDVGEGDSIMDKITGWFDELKTLAEEEGWGAVGKKLGEDLSDIISDINNFILEMQPKIIEAAGLAGEFVNGFIEGFDFDILGETIGNGINTVVKALNEFWSKIDFATLGTKLASGFMKLVETIDWQALGQRAIDKFNHIVTLIKNFFGGLNGEEIGKDLQLWFNTIVDNLDEQELADAIVNVLKFLIDTAKSFFDGAKIDELKTKINNAAKSVAQQMGWSDILGAVTPGLASIVAGVITFISDNIIPIANAIGKALSTLLESVDWADLGMNLGVAIHNLLPVLLAALGDIFIAITVALGTFLLSILIDVGKGISDIFKSIGDKLYEIGLSIDNWFDEVAEKNLAFVKGLWDDVVNWFNDKKTKIVDKFNEIGTNVSNWFNDTKTKVVDKVNEIGTSVGNWFAEAPGKIQERLKTIWGTVSGWFDEKLTAIKNFFGDIITYFKTDFKTDWENAWKGISDKFNEIIGGVGDFFKGIINGIIDALNFVIDKMNGLSFDVPDWVPGIGGSTFGFDIPKIPHLAQGAVIPPNQEFMAILGDQKSGVNIETPLATMVDAFKQALYEFGGELGEGGDIYIPVYVNSELTTEQIIRRQDIARYRSNGK